MDKKMDMKLDTICHADRLAHEFFGELDLLHVVHPGEPIAEGTTGWILRPDGSRLAIRVKGFWKDRRKPDPLMLVVVVEPLPVHPSELEGCPIRWGNPL